MYVCVHVRVCVCEEDVHEKRVKEKEKRVKRKHKLIHPDKQTDRQTDRQTDTNHSLI